MEYAVIEAGGKQYNITPGMTIEIDRVSDSKGEILFDKVLLYVNGSEMSLGKPYLSGYSVKGKLVENFKGEKVRVARFKAKSRYRKVTGFRAALSRVQIEKIVSTSKAPKAKK